MRVSMYFLHLVLTFTPHYIITDKGLLSLYSCVEKIKTTKYVVCIVQERAATHENKSREEFRFSLFRDNITNYTV